MGDNNVKLPPGFRFCPTDEELVVHFLHRKAILLPCHPEVIPDLDLYPYDPWELDGTIYICFCFFSISCHVFSVPIYISAIACVIYLIFFDFTLGLFYKEKII